MHLPHRSLYEVAFGSGDNCGDNSDAGTVYRDIVSTVAFIVCATETHLKSDELLRERERERKYHTPSVYNFITLRCACPYVISLLFSIKTA